MKETELHTKDQVEIVKQVQQKKFKTFLGLMIPGDGHKLFELEHATQSVRIVTVEKSKDVNFNQAKRKLLPGEVFIPHETNRQKFAARDGCTYMYALNERTAMKKFLKKFPYPNIIFVDES